MKTNSSRPTVCAPSRASIAIILTSFAWATTNTASTTFRAKGRVTCSAATRTGAGRSGFQLTSSSSKRSSVITFSTANRLRSSARPVQEIWRHSSRSLTNFRAGSRAFSCRTKTANAHVTASSTSTPPIRIGAIWFYSTNTSTAKPGAVWAQAIRPAGPLWR